MTTEETRALQQALNDKGANPPLKVDGIPGPKTTAAVVEFQKRTPGLVVDGKPGPKTLAALGLSAKVEAPKGDSRDVNAYAIAKRVGSGLTEAERQYVLAVARGEGGYGAGWGKPPSDPVALAFAQSKGLTGTEGVGSNNWGAEQGKGDAGSFPHVDFGWRNPDGSAWNGKGPKVWLPYIGYYRKWSTPEKGFQSLAQTVLGGLKRGAEGSKAIREAIAAGDLKAAVYAQHANGYFELDPAKYLEAVERNYEALSNATGWKRAFGGSGAGGLGTMLILVGVAAAGAAAWLLARKA